MYEDMKDIPDYNGKIVQSVRFGLDSNGYTTLIIKFNEGPDLVAKEEGQAGYFVIDGVD
jgi:hypothetical protein